MMRQPGTGHGAAMPTKARAPMRRPVDWSPLVGFAAAAAGALAGRHARAGVHGALCPEALVADKAGGVRLVHPDPLPANRFRYGAPEQSGRLSRGVDERADLYALGVLLYEMVAGDVPFPAENSAELAHRQLTGEPVRLRTLVPDLPIVLDDIVLQLLATMPEGRYQTAGGLAEDLTRCRDQLAGSGVIQPFLLAGRDVRADILPSGRLYGRTARISRMTTAYERVAAAGGVDLQVVSADAGMGKTALLGGFADVIVREGGRVARTAFTADEVVSYAAFARLVTDLVEHLLMESDGRPEPWRSRLVEVLGSGSGVLVDLVSSFARLFGAEPPAAAVGWAGLSTPGGGGDFARNRLRLAVRRLLSALGAPGSPLVLVLDDLHLADAASVELLRYVLDDPQSQHLLVVAAYRPKEAMSPHPLAQLLKERNIHHPNASAALRPLPDVAVTELLVETLRTEKRKSQPLSRVVVDKTGSSPGAIGEFLLRLRDDRLLVHDDSGPSWDWDLDGIQATAPVDVRDTVAFRIDRLPGSLLRLLRLAAVLGARFSLGELAVVAERAPAELVADLRRAVREQVLVGVGGPGRHVGVTGYRWTHEVVRCAVLAELTEADRRRLRLTVGRALLAAAARTGAAAGSEPYRVAVGHLNAATGLIDSVGERVRLAELNLAVGTRAFRLGATASARDLLLTAYDLLASAGPAPPPGLAYAVHVEAARAVSDMGDIEHAEALLKRAQPFAAGDLDRARLLGLVSRCRCTAGAFGAALEPARRALHLLDVGLPADRQLWPALARSAVRRLGTRLDAGSIDETVRAPVATDPRAILATEILADLLSSSLFPPVRPVPPVRMVPGPRKPRCAGRSPAGAGSAAAPALGPDVSTLLAATAVELVLDGGLTRSAAVLFAGYATALAAGAGEERHAGQCARLALRLLETTSAPEYAGRVAQVVAFVPALWAEVSVAPLELLREACAAAMEYGDLRRAADNRILLAAHSFVTGVPLEAVAAEIGHAWRLVERPDGDALLRAVVSVADDAVSRLRGLPGVIAPDSPVEVARTVEVLAGTAGYACTVALAFAVPAAYLLGNHDRARELVRTAAEVGPADDRRAWRSYLAAGTDLFHTLALIARYDAVDPPERKAVIAGLDVRQGIFDDWAAHAPVAFGAQALLLSAQRARLAGDPLQVHARFDAAIDAARERGVAPVEAMAAELGGRYALARGDTSEVVAYLRRARTCYERWGALGKLGHLDQMLAEVAAPVEAEHPLDQLDLLGVVRVFQGLSAELGLDRLVVTLLTLLMQHARAERGALLVTSPQGLRLVAVADADRGQVTVVPEPAGPPADEVPMAVVEAVNQCGQTVSREFGSLSDEFADDPYLVRTRPQSLVCAPLVRTGKLVGMLYLEHRRLSVPFTQEYLDMLEVLCAQAAIALENATVHARLLEANRILDATFDRLPVGLILLGSDLKVRRASPRAIQITGLPIRAGTPLVDLLDVMTPTDEAGDPYRFEPGFARVAADVEPINRNIPIISPDGRRRWLQTSAIPLRDGRGVLVGVTLLVAELT